MQTKILENTDLREFIPSVFAETPWHERSEKYKFIPTIDVINALRDTGFYPVSARQSSIRIPGKKDYTKHYLRFRAREDVDRVLEVNDLIPEIGLINSHDGTSAYKIMFGLFRCFCSNQCVTADSELENIRVRHMGQGDLCRDVIDITKETFKKAPAVMATVNRWQGLILTPPEQRVLARAAKEIYPSTIDVDAARFLRARRRVDMAENNGNRSLWQTFNVIQENTTKGRLLGKGSNGRYRRTRAIKSVDNDVKLNKGLWTLAQKMEELKR